jgi:hypothetical protein
MTAEEAIAEVGKLNDRLRERDEKVRQAMNGRASETIPQLQRGIAEATARKQCLLAQIQRMQKAGS